MSVISSVVADGGGAARSSDATSANSGRSDDRSSIDPFALDPFTNGVELPEINLGQLGAIVMLADIIRRWVNGR